MMPLARDHPFGVTASVYVLVVCVVALLLSIFRSESNYIATRRLEPNHRIVSGDYREPEGWLAGLGFYLPSRSALDGKYVQKGAVDPKQPIDPGALGEKPTPLPLANEEIEVVPLSAVSGLVAVLDAGLSVAVTGQNDDRNTVYFTATVHAILCDAKKGDQPSCRAVLRIPSGQYLKLPKDLSGLRLIVQPNPRLP